MVGQGVSGNRSPSEIIFAKFDVKNGMNARGSSCLIDYLITVLQSTKDFYVSIMTQEIHVI